MMRILLCHNYYQEPGGEDQVFADEASLLESYGHEVECFTLHNDAIQQMSSWDAARRALWNPQSYIDLQALLRRWRPTIMHCTNIFPLISPAAYYAARTEGVTVVQSLHNYRLFCCNAMFFRDKRVCEDCIGRFIPWPSVMYSCYRNHRAASAIVAVMVGMHRGLGTWLRTVDMYIALTEFSRRKFIEGGLPANKVVVKPNFVHPDPGLGKGSGGYVVFVGRLAPEKGIDTLISGWSRVQKQVSLKIVGDGPLADLVRQATAKDARLRWLGRRTPDEVYTIVGDAICLLMPSIWHEGLPKTILEAFAKGTPIIASRRGAMAEVVDHGRTGLHFEPGDPNDLALKVHQLLDGRRKLARMRQFAREEYERKYTANLNYRMLMSIYEQASAGTLAQIGRRC